MSKTDDCTLLVLSCDKYRDIEEPFITLFRRYWTDCPFEVVLATETDAHTAAQAEFDRVIAMGTGLDWSAGVARALEQITTPYVFILLNDYFLTRKVDTELVVRRYEQFKHYKAVNLRLVASPKPTPATARPYRSPAVRLFEIRKNRAYCVSTQAGFWDRAYLLGIVSQTKSAWEFERKGSYLVKDEKRPILCTPRRELPFVDAIHKGYWEVFGAELLKCNDIAFDFAQRGFPPPGVRVKEGLKKLIFNIWPEGVVRLQNLVGGKS